MDYKEPKTLEETVDNYMNKLGIISGVLLAITAIIIYIGTH